MRHAMSQARKRPTTADEGVELPSGRLLVRMPRKLHAELARAAEQEGVSLNQLITTRLASSVGWRDESGQAADAGPHPQWSRSRLIPLALAANLVVVTLAGLIAIVLLIVAWQAGG